MKDKGWEARGKGQGDRGEGERKLKGGRARKQTYHRAGPRRAGPRGGPGAGVEVAAVL